MSFLGPPREAPWREHVAAWPRSRWIIIGLTFLTTGVIAAMFLLESRWGYSGRVVKVVYVQSWPATRSAADTIRDRDSAVAARRAEIDRSRAYVAALPPAQRAKAQKQLDTYVRALDAELRPRQP